MVISVDDINAILPVINSLPITSYKQDRRVYPNEVFLQKEQSSLDKDSVVLCYQVCTIDKKRLIKKIGEIKDDDVKSEIIDALSFQLGL